MTLVVQPAHTDVSGMLEGQKGCMRILFVNVNKSSKLWSAESQENCTTDGRRGHYLFVRRKLWTGEQRLERTGD